MSHATRLLLIWTSASIQEMVRQQFEELWENQRVVVEQVVLKFLGTEINPATVFDFETQVAEEVRELARQLVEQVLNQIEPDDPDEMLQDVEHQGGGYRRLNRKTRNAHVATLFGTIELWRYAYRYWHRDVSETCVFPSEIALGRRRIIRQQGGGPTPRAGRWRTRRQTGGIASTMRPGKVIVACQAGRVCASY
jgi:hypothetical protein